LSGSGRPLFVALEGIDGSGTTTQASLLARYLEGRGRRAAVTREPSTGPVGRLLREILLGGHRLEDGRALGERTMALLFAADRHDHVEREIRPFLARGVDVITDRYLWSSLVYQSESNAREWVQGLALGLPEPDLTVLVDVPATVAAARRQQAGRPHERYDEDATQERVARAYRALAAASPAAVVVDGVGGVDEVAARIAEAVRRCLERSSQGASS
jgi:dTMP kinase